MTRLSLFAPSILAAMIAACAHEEAPIEKPSPEATNYRAIGQEPGWSLDILGDRIILDTNYGENRYEFTPSPKALNIDGGTQYNLLSNGPTSKIIIYNEICADIMSGMNYPDRVRIMIDDQTLDGCGGDPRDLLTGGEWIVEDLSGGGVIDAARTSLVFHEDGGVSGKGGCNRFNAAYRLTGEGISFGPIASTKMACPPTLMNQEMLFFNILSAVANFEIAEDGALVLRTNDQRAIRARR